MKVAIVFFTYREDARLLEQAMRAVAGLRARNEGDVFDVYVFDDAGAPLEMVPAGVSYARTDFPRKGNLNGVACVQGMLEQYAKILQAGGYDWVIKVDCDTYVNDVEWLRRLDPGHLAQVGTNHVGDYNSGACYAVSSRGVAAMQKLLESEVVRKRVDRAFCEDKCFCRLGMMTGLGVMRIYNAENELESGKLYHDWLAGGTRQLEELGVAYAVDFKRCRWHTVKENYAGDREQALDRMKAYADMRAKEIL